MNDLRLVGRDVKVIEQGLRHVVVLDVCRADQDMFQYKQLIQRTFQGSVVKRLLITDLDSAKLLVLGDARLVWSKPVQGDAYGSVKFGWMGKWLSEISDLKMWADK